MYPRILEYQLTKKFGKGKAILLLGPRQVGKTTLVQRMLHKKKHVSLNADDPTVRQMLHNANTAQLGNLIGQSKIVFVDEAQRIPDIGITLKLVTDQFKDVQLIISGSSSLELGNAFNEPLTGRKWEFQMLPISWQEFELKHGVLKADQQLEDRLIYGFYPDVLNNPEDQRAILNELVTSYLYRDVLAYSGIRKSDMLEKLLRALALQVGSEVSYNEVAQLIGVDKKTVSAYIDELEKSFVLFKLFTISKNQRNEIKTNRKIYFYDVGIRNAIIGNFLPLHARTDKGALWENFLITERIKQLRYNDPFVSSYFWRTKQQQEVDYVEVTNGQVMGYEFKWQSKKTFGLSKTFLRTYDAQQKIIDRQNFREFVYYKG